MSYRKIKLTWGENKVEVPVTIDLAQDITDEMGSPFLLARDIFKGEIPDYAKGSKLISLILAKGGVDVDPMEIWDTLNSLDNTAKVTSAFSDILTALCPTWEGEQSDEGKTQAQ